MFGKTFDLVDGIIPFIFHPVRRVQTSVKLKTVRHIVQMNKTGRNEACPCGSGVKFKKCCLNKV